MRRAEQTLAKHAKNAEKARQEQELVPQRTSRMQPIHYLSVTVIPSGTGRDHRGIGWVGVPPGIGSQSKTRDATCPVGGITQTTSCEKTTDRSRVVYYA